MAKQSKRIPAARELPASDECNATFEIPAVLSERLDRLVTMLERPGVDPQGKVVHQRTTTRKELVSALLYDVPAELQVLQELLERYRNATAGSARIPPIENGRITVKVRSPGLRLTSDQEQQRQRGVEKPPRRNRSSSLSGERR